MSFERTSGLLVLAVLFSACTENSIRQPGSLTATSNAPAFPSSSGPGLETSRALLNSVKPSLGGIRSLDQLGAVGDGVADDTMAFTAAAAVGGYFFILGKKTYRVTSPVRFDKAAMLASDGTASIQFEGEGRFVIHASDITLTGFSAEASRQTSSNCVFTLDNNVKGWLTNITLSNLKVSAAPCLIKDTISPAVFSGDSSIVGLYVDNVQSLKARGPQIELKSAFAFTFLRKVTIVADRPINSAMIRLERNQGAGFTGIKIQGAGGSGDGLRLDNFAAVWISDTDIRGVGGSGLATGQTYTGYGPNSFLYLRNVVVVGNGQLGIDAQNINSLLALDTQWAANGTGGMNTTGSSPMLGYLSSTSWFPAPPASFSNQPDLLAPDPANFVSVTEYGAKGDGINDDSNAFAMALGSGKNVFIPPTSSRYRLTKTVVLPRPVAVVGAGSKIFSEAGHAFDIVSSSVTLQGLQIAMSPSPYAIAVYLNPTASALSKIKLVDLETVSAGYSITNYGSATNPISDLVVAKLRVQDFRNIAVNFKNLENASIDRVFGNIPQVQMSTPLIWLSDVRNSILSESTMLGKGPSTTTESATTVVLENSKNVQLRRYMADTTNSYGLAILGSTQVYVSESVFGTDLTPIVIDRSTLVFALNTLVAKNSSNQMEAFRITNSNTVVFANLIDLKGPLNVTSQNNANILFQNYSAH